MLALFHYCLHYPHVICWLCLYTASSILPDRGFLTDDGFLLSFVNNSSVYDEGIWLPLVSSETDLPSVYPQLILGNQDPNRTLFNQWFVLFLYCLSFISNAYYEFYIDSVYSHTYYELAVFILFKGLF